MKTKQEVLAEIAASPVKMGQIWQHHKTMGQYAVVAFGIHEGTMTPVVAYVENDGTVWFRNLEVFLGDSGGKPRFVMVGDITTFDENAPLDEHLEGLIAEDAEDARSFGE
jgi:hypothetical protein